MASRSPGPAGWQISAGRLRWLMNLWPPFLFTGIRVQSIAPDFSSVKVALRRGWLNRNYVGTHFGGSLFAMTDPFWMILVMHQLGRDHVVWDKAAEIEFVAPGRSDVFAELRLPAARMDAIRARSASGGKLLEWFDTEVVDGDGAVIARVRKQLYIRRKRDQDAGGGGTTAGSE